MREHGGACECVFARGAVLSLVYRRAMLCEMRELACVSVQSSPAAGVQLRLPDIVSPPAQIGFSRSRRYNWPGRQPSARVMTAASTQPVAVS